MTFLDEHHHRKAPCELARWRWDQWIEQGARALQQKDYSCALGLIGSSFKLGEIQLDNHHPGERKGAPKDDLRWVDRYMVAGHYLAEYYKRLNLPSLELHTLLKVHHRLSALIEDEQQLSPHLHFNMKISLQMIHRYQQRNGRFIAYQQCAENTAQLLHADMH